MKKTLLILLIIVFGLCCCAALTITVGGWAIFKSSPQAKSESFVVTVPVSETVIQPTTVTNEVKPQPTFEPSKYPTNDEAYQTLKTLEQTDVPINDLRDLAQRLKGIKNIPETIQEPVKNYNIGDTTKFWVSEDDTHKNYEVNAVLRYKGDHLYFWVDKESSYNQPDLEKLADTFDKKIYPTNREFFGSEWSPGIDNDPHLYILYVHGIGFRIAGYFSSNDEINPEAHKYSNAHEMFIINSDTTALNEEFTYGVLAHEFQHMIHWYRDRNEESWLNEGFSELAAFLNGYDVGGFDYVFTENPDLQLNDWPNDPNATTPHYGAGFLFVNYFLDRFGEKATQALVGSPLNGMESVDNVLHDLAITDPMTGEPITADDFFVDWTISNYLHDVNAADGRYQYHDYEAAPRVEVGQIVKECPYSLDNQTVSQYGADYTEINCSGSYTLTFQGKAETTLVPSDAHSGKYMFWSNKGDESDMTLTRRFDLRKANGDVSLHYWTWYDLEKDFDYTYVEVSEDGQTWKILNTPSGTAKDPSGNSYGWGYNGTTVGWVQEKVNLNEYMGKTIWVRFEYITDAAVNGEGFLLDDISIPAINYSSDFETDNGGWDAAGFVRVQNVLPQKYHLSMIEITPEGTTVKKVAVESNQNLKIPFELKDERSKMVLIISGITRFTRSSAPYAISIE